MKLRDRASCGSVEVMKQKKKKERRPNPTKSFKPHVDEGIFTDIITRMVNTPPLPLKDVPIRRNPERDPRYQPVFDFDRRILITDDVAEDIAETDKVNRDFRKKRGDS